jgi:hypothetical protein
VGIAAAGAVTTTMKACAAKTELSTVETQMKTTPVAQAPPVLFSLPDKHYAIFSIAEDTCAACGLKQAIAFERIVFCPACTESFTSEQQYRTDKPLSQLAN